MMPLLTGNKNKEPASSGSRWKDPGSVMMGLGTTTQQHFVDLSTDHSSEKLQADEIEAASTDPLSLKGKRGRQKIVQVLVSDEKQWKLLKEQMRCQNTITNVASHVVLHSRILPEVGRSMNSRLRREQSDSQLRPRGSGVLCGPVVHHGERMQKRSTWSPNVLKNALSVFNMSSVGSDEGEGRGDASDVVSTGSFHWQQLGTEMTSRPSSLSLLSLSQAAHQRLHHDVNYNGNLHNFKGIINGRESSVQRQGETPMMKSKSWGSLAMRKNFQQRGKSVRNREVGVVLPRSASSSTRLQQIITKFSSEYCVDDGSSNDGRFTLQVTSGRCNANGTDTEDTERNHSNDDGRRSKASRRTGRRVSWSQRVDEKEQQPAGRDNVASDDMVALQTFLDDFADPEDSSDSDEDDNLGFKLDLSSRPTPADEDSNGVGGSSFGFGKGSDSVATQPRNGMGKNEKSDGLMLEQFSDRPRGRQHQSVTSDFATATEKSIQRSLRSSNQIEEMQNRRNRRASKLSRRVQGEADSANAEWKEQDFSRGGSFKRYGSMRDFL